MNRYKIGAEQIPIVKKFLAGKAVNSVPNWAKKYKSDLSVKRGKVFYQEKEIVPKENVNEYLRKIFYTKDEVVPLSRDGAFHIIFKQRPVIGVSRRAIMTFIKGQEPIESGRAAVPQRKKKGGIPLKGYYFETDLIFIRKNDLVNANPRFRKSYKYQKDETYIVSTVEKLTGLVRVQHVTTKDKNIVGPIVVKQVSEMCKQLGTTAANVSLASDQGGEFSKKYLSKYVKNYTQVKLGSSVEKRNRDIQTTMFQMFRTRRALDIKSALRQTQEIVNNNYNRIQKKTPNDSAKEPEQESKLNYNRKRQEAGTAGLRKLEVGDHVRILIKKAKATLDYKTYKNRTFTKDVYIVSKKTKTAKVPKYYVNKRWYTSDTLLNTKPVDKKSKELVKKRDADVEEADEKEGKAHLKKRLADLKKDVAESTTGRRRPMRGAARKGRIAALKRMQEDRRLAKLLGE